MDKKDLKEYRTTKISAKKSFFSSAKNVYILIGSLLALVLIILGLSLFPYGSGSASVESKTYFSKRASSAYFDNSFPRSESNKTPNSESNKPSSSESYKPHSSDAKKLFNSESNKLSSSESNKLSSSESNKLSSSESKKPSNSESKTHSNSESKTHSNSESKKPSNSESKKSPSSEFNEPPSSEFNEPPSSESNEPPSSESNEPPSSESNSYDLSGSMGCDIFDPTESEVLDTVNPSHPTVKNGKIIFLESSGTFSPPENRNFMYNSIYMPEPSYDLNNFSFFTINYDGTDLKKLEIEQPDDEPSLIFSNISLPTFSFNGKMIAFLRQNDDRNKCSLFIMNSDGRKTTRLASSVDQGFGIAFTNDNRNIIYQNGLKVFSVNIETRVASIFNDYIFAVYPKFSADGKFLLVESEGGWGSFIEFRNVDNGNRIENLFLYANQGSHFSISPDSKSIACTTTSQDFTNHFNLEQVSIMNLEDKTKKEIIFTCKNKSDHLEYVTWSPDGKYLLVRISDSILKKNYLALINLEEKDGNSKYTANPILKENGETVNGVELSWQSIV